jgi:hypothetical protein
MGQKARMAALRLLVTLYAEGHKRRREIALPPSFDAYNV